MRIGSGSIRKRGKAYERIGRDGERCRVGSTRELRGRGREVRHIRGERQEGEDEDCGGCLFFLVGKNTHLHPIFMLLFSIAPYYFFSTCLHYELCNVTTLHPLFKSVN